MTAPGASPDLTTTDGCTLRTREWTAESSRAVVVLVHGFAASTGDAAVIRQAEALRACGFSVVSYDSRGHGASDGLCTLGDLEEHDVAAAVAAAKQRGLPVVLVGASMGAIAALRYAARDPELAGVVAISAPASWKAPRSAQGILAATLTQTGLGRVLAERLLRVHLASGWSSPAPPCELVTRLRVPVAIVHGDRDRFIRPRDAAEIHRACPAPRRLDVVPGMGHAFDAMALPAVSAAVEWAVATTEAAASR